MELVLPILLIMAVPEVEPAQATSMPVIDQQGVVVQYRSAPVAQVRVEQRLIIRIPRSRVATRPLSEMRLHPVPRLLKEKNLGKCVAMEGIIGVRRIVRKHSLDLFTKNNLLIRAHLADKCLANEFYSGFYMEKSKDGKFCVGREILQARSGVKCEVKEFRQLVAE